MHSNEPVNPTVHPIFVAMDMAKDTFALAWTGSAKVHELPNSPQGHAKCIALIEPLEPQRIVLEATGGYESRLMIALHQAGLPVDRVNPRRVRDYAKSQGIHGKTDRLDARMMVDFAAQLKDPPRPLPDEKALELKELTTRHRQLTKAITAERNRQQTFHGQAMRDDVQTIIDALATQLKQIEQRIDDMIDEHEQWKRKAELLQTACGIGPGNARTMVAHLPELGQCSRQKIAAIVGLAPYHRDSGKFKGKRKVQGGRAPVRAMLYMAARTAARFNPVIHACYQRLINNGKTDKVAITACMRKLLTILNAMVRDQTPWKKPQTT